MEKAENVGYITPEPDRRLDQFHSHIHEFAAGQQRSVHGRVRQLERTPVVRLDRFVDGLFEFSVVNQALHHLLFHEAGFSEDDVLAGARSILERVLADGATSGVFDPNDPAIGRISAPRFAGLLVDAMRADAAQRQRYTSAARELARRSVRRGGKKLG